MRDSRLLVAALAALAVSCRSAAPPAVIDPGMASYVPSDTLLLAGLDVPAVRSSPLGRNLPLVAPLLESLQEATHLLLASNGKDLLTIARGRFHTAPAGWTLVEPTLAVSGAAGHGARSPLLSYAASVAMGKPIWIVARGGVALPLTGNAANLNRLLRDSEFAAVTAALGPRIQIEAAVVGRTPEAARDVETTLRAVLAMMTMAEKRGSDAAALLGAVEIRREDRTVHASVSAAPDTLGQLLIR